MSDPVKILLRRDTAANWGSENPILASGEIGIDLTSGRFKIGDNATAWNSLPWGAATPDASTLTSGTLDAARLPTQSTATWEAGVGTDESAVSPAKVAAAIAALASGGSPAGSGTELQYRNAGSFGAVAGTSWASNQLLITAQAAATTPLAIRAAASHTANIQEWKNSAGTVLTRISSNGAIISTQDCIAGGAISGGAFRATTVYANLSSAVGWGWTAITTPNAAQETALFRVASKIIGIRGSSVSEGASLSFIEQTAPSAPAANGVYIYAEDDGGGKTRLMALFSTGAAQQIAIEP